MESAQTLDAINSNPVLSDLTEAEREAYRERCYFIRRAIFNERDLVKLRTAVENIHRKIVAAADSAEVERIDGLRFQDLLGSRIKWEWKEGVTQIRSMEPVFHLSPAVDDLIDDDRLCSPIRGLLETPEVSLFTDKLNFKRPGGAPFPWHQDAPYWAFRCKHLDQLVSVQIYLDEATEQNGCLWAIPGSHRHGHVKPPKDRPDTPLNRLYSDVGTLDGLSPEPLVAPAGSAIFFNSWVVHGSKGNASDNSRRALVMTYQPGGLPLRETDVVRTPRRERGGVGALAGRLKALFKGGA